MPDYKSMYFQLFNRVSDAIDTLQKAQLDAEETYIDNLEELNKIDHAQLQEVVKEKVQKMTENGINR